LQCFGSRFIESGSGSNILGSIPIQIQIQGFDDQKFYENCSEIAIYLSRRLRKGRPSCRRSLQPSKESIHHIKT
jgi:hypothetical protein